MSSQLTRLVLFPGLAADSRLFEPQVDALSDHVRVETLNWIEPASPSESIEAYAARMARLIRPASRDGRLFLGGASLGALVALEAARHLQATGVFMIGGCRDARSIAPFFRFACWLGSHLPLPLLKFFLHGAAAALVLFESMSWAHMRLYSRMVNDASVRQVRWSAGALLKYRSAGDPPGVRVRLMHGQRDLLIPRKRVDADYVVRGGRHLVALSRAAEVNAYLLREMSGEFDQVVDD